jgi:polysaccharide pyruvyl transferase WcaK-like protein
VLATLSAREGTDVATSNSSTKICLLGLEPTNANLGVRALIAGSIACILHQYPGAEISILDYAKEGGVIPFRFGERVVSLRLVNVRFSKNFFSEDHIVHLLVVATLYRLMPTKGMRQALIERNPRLRHIHGMDLVAAISGGDSFSDIYGLSRLLYVSLPQILALWSGKQLVLLPQTLGPFKSRFARAIAKYIMKRARVVYSRDHAGVKSGAAMLGANGHSGKFRFCYDVGFLAEAKEPRNLVPVGMAPRGDTEIPLVGLNVSGLLFMGGYSRDNMFGLRVEYKMLIFDLIEFLIATKRASVMLIPHLLGFDGEGDSLACDVVYQALKNRFPGRISLIRADYEQYDQSEIKHVIGGCDFFIGSRMHACIGAVSQNVPSVSIAYSDKFAGVMESVGVGSIVADLRKVGEEDILRIVGETFDARDRIREQLRQTIPHVKETVLGLFSEMEELQK